MTSTYDALRAERLATISDEYRAMVEGWPRLDEIGVDNLRGAIEGMAGQVPVASGVEIRDVEVPGPAGPVATRIYTPAGADASTGVVLHIHYGGFVAGGGTATLDGENSAIAAGVPCIVVAPDFRLPPEHRFPAGLDDCWAVLNWIAASGAEQGWEGAKVAVGGGCTGGNFAAALALMARDAGGPAVSLQFLQSWIADARFDTRSQFEFADGYGLRRSDNEWVTAQYLNDPEERWDWRVSPLLAESVRDVAPAYISVGEWDVLRDEDVQYGQRLQDAGVPVTVRVLPGEGHVGNPETAASRAADLHDALRRALS